MRDRRGNLLPGKLILLYNGFRHKTNLCVYLY